MDVYGPPFGRPKPTAVSPTNGRRLRRRHRSRHDLIVVGASAGGLDALRHLLSGLPADLSAAVFVVVHCSSFVQSKYATSFLLEALNEVGPLPVIHPRNGSSIEPGLIYLAPPDQHLWLEDGRVELLRSPKEVCCRPAINPLFRSAALAYRSRVVGIILSGLLDDGTAGLWEVKRRGGLAVVQRPEDARYPTMPLSALENVDVDYCLRASEIGPLLGMLALGAVRIPSKTKAPYLLPGEYASPNLIAKGT